MGQSELENFNKLKKLKNCLINELLGAFLVRKNVYIVSVSDWPKVYSPQTNTLYDYSMRITVEELLVCEKSKKEESFYQSMPKYYYIINELLRAFLVKQLILQ